MSTLPPSDDGCGPVEDVVGEGVVPEVARVKIVEETRLEEVNALEYEEMELDEEPIELEVELIGELVGLEEELLELEGDLVGDPLELEVVCGYMLTPTVVWTREKASGPLQSQYSVV